MPKPFPSQPKPPSLVRGLIRAIAGLLLVWASGWPAEALGQQPATPTESQVLDSDARVSLALWAMQAVEEGEARENQNPAQPPGKTLPNQDSWVIPPEALLLKGSIPDSCFQEGGGVKLASANGSYPLWQEPISPNPPAGSPMSGRLPAPTDPRSGSQPLPGPAPPLPHGYPLNSGTPGHPSSPMHSPHPVSSGLPLPKPSPDGVDPHWELFAKSQYPSASECAVCHQQIYDEWANSSHAYAAISPMFHAFEQTITRLSQGTIGYFCLRCHAPVATTMGHDRTAPIWAGPQVFREGVTCVACHRVKYPYVKPNGERRIEPGDIHAPVYGTSDGVGNAVAVKFKDFFKVKIDPRDPTPTQPIHQRVIQFEELRESTFCASCHQVAVQPGIKLEVVWDQYRGSPACREGISCQDCHMGRVPGRAEGYSFGPAAVVNEKAVLPERRHSNHNFHGPGYSIAHPGVFPFEKDPDRWSFNTWQQFDWRAGWGTREFEEAVAAGRIRTWFPPEWSNVDDRMDARQKVDRNLKKLQYKLEIRRQVMENGSRVDGPFFDCSPRVGQPLEFRYLVTSTNRGHNMPSGSLGAQPQLWVNVALIDPAGQLIWESGDLDSYGDLRDIHSTDVTAGRLPLDRQLVNFQTKFLITNIKGTDREIPLPVNIDVDQLPFLRPPAQPTTVINHPPLIRMEAHSIPPLGSRRCDYSVPAHLLQMPGTYRLSIRLRSRLEPMYFMRFCNATDEMIRMMQEWTVNFHEHSVVFEVDP